MSGITKEIIEAFVAPLAKHRGLHILHCIVRGTSSRPVIEISLDGSKPVLIEDCEHISRSLLEYIEGSEYKNLNYRLDVLSPGVDEPIIHDYQFQRTISKLVALSYKKEEIDLPKKGILTGFSETTVTITQEISGVKGTKPKLGEEIVVDRDRISLLKQVAVIR